MTHNPGRRSGIALTFILLAAVMLISCQAFKRLGGSGIDEANQLDQSASADRAEVERIAQENKVKESQITAALNAHNYDAAKQLIDDTLKVIDQALAKAQSAADKWDKASKLDVDQTIKDYLSLREQSASKAIEAGKELRQGLASFRDSIGSTDKAVTDKAQRDVQQSVGKFQDLIVQANMLESQADEMARKNPDKIKAGRQF